MDTSTPAEMSKDEKTLRVIDSLQQGIKLVVELSTKGIVFHLGITAFSATFAFDRSPTAKTAIIILNVLVNFFAAASILLAARAINAKRATVIALYEQIGVDIGATPGPKSSLTRTPQFYALFCGLLVVFWIVSFWLPAKPAEASPSTHAATPTATP